MEEEIVKDKWCPFARSCWKQDAPNRWAEGESMQGTQCIGSQCMMWRPYWDKGETGFATKGYCGLAGKP